MRTNETRRGGCEGMTLVEVMIAMGILGIMLGGLLYCVISAQRMGEYLRESTEARAWAKACMELLTAAGRDRIGQPGYQEVQMVTNYTSADHPMIRNVRMHWHDGNGQAASADSNEYVEVHVDTVFYSAVAGGMSTTTVSGIIR